MGDIKNIRVDNWGMFFLQRLQNFFNKTDYCDLTLQFHDNTQLKVHRLVLNACTEYFTILEQNCEMIEDCLIMPMDLQADVVVPIVNFMYTGQLEFKYSLLDRLQTTAHIMNMTILTKLLNAQKVHSPSASKPVLLNRQNPIIPITYNLQGRNIVPKPDVEYSMPARKSWKRRPVAFSYSGDGNDAEPLTLRMNRAKPSRHIDNSPRPTRFEPTEECNDSIFETSFDNISYESKPFALAKTGSDQNASSESKASTSGCSFEELRKGYVQKRPASPSPTPQEPKRVNLQEVKEYVDAHRLRANYEMEENEDDPDEDEQDNGNDAYDSGHDYEDDADSNQTARVLQSSETSLRSSQTTKTDQQKTLVNVKQESSVNHARIISEVLKKYPHLVKNNRNIKLKVVQQKSAPSKPNEKKVVIGVSKESIVNTTSKTSLPKSTNFVNSASKINEQPKVIDAKKMHALLALGAENTTGPWLCLRCGTNGRPISFPTYAIFRKHLVKIHDEKIDVRICEHCGHKSNKRNYLYFHLYTKHGIKPPNNISFPKCSQCNYVALNEALLVKHRFNHTKLNEFVCNQCTAWFKTKQALITHMAQTGHKIGPNTKESQQCIYCNKPFLREANMYAHVRTMHRDQARQDGIIEFSDDEEQQYEEADAALEMEENNDKYIPNNPQLAKENDGKIKILSNIALPNVSSKEMQYIISPSSQNVSKIGGQSQKTVRQQIVTSEGMILQSAVIQNLEPSSEAEALNNVASGIATSLGLVDSIVVMDNQYELTDQNIDGSQDGSQFIVNQMQLEEVNEENATESLPDQSHTSHENIQGQVQAEIQTGITTTKIITQGDVLKLTESQQNEIINELQNSNHLTSRNNVVMVLTEDQYKHVKDNQIQNDENIYVVYSQASQIDVTEKQYLQIGESGELVGDTTDLSNTVAEEGLDESAENNDQGVLDHETVEQWPEETVEMISQELRKQIQNDGDDELINNHLLNKNKRDEGNQSYETEQLKNEEDNVESILQGETVKETNSLNENMEIEETDLTEIPPKDVIIENIQGPNEDKVDMERKNTILTNFTEDWNEEHLSKDMEVHLKTDLKEEPSYEMSHEQDQELPVGEVYVTDEVVDTDEKEIHNAESPKYSSPVQSEEQINEESVKSTGSNKITKLLDDWEDTDSHEDVKVAANNDGTEPQHAMTSDQIHKLMDDWTEEDTAMEM